jgi:nitrite reductase/ring-hydroxylating ferredoxin subunit
MFRKKHRWHKVAAHASEIVLNRNDIGIVEIEGKKICLAKFKNDWFAFAHHCPHAGGLMSQGFLDLSGNIACPVHGYKFNLRNGRCKIPEGYRLSTYKVESRVDGLFIGIEEGTSI